jgi:hypothetical protein
MSEMSDYRERVCTCHPDVAPRPCPQRYAYSECLLAAEAERQRADNAKLRAEIERLVGEIEKIWQTQARAALLREQEMKEKRAEIERLRRENEDLRRWKAMDKPFTAAMGVVVADIQQLRAERDAARAALKKMLEVYAPWALSNPDEPDAVTGEQHIAAMEARDALEGRGNDRPTA